MLSKQEMNAKEITSEQKPEMDKKDYEKKFREKWQNFCMKSEWNSYVFMVWINKKNKLE